MKPDPFKFYGVIAMFVLGFSFNYSLNNYDVSLLLKAATIISGMTFLSLAVLLGVGYKSPEDNE